MAKINIPDGVKLVGANIVPTIAEMVAGGGGNGSDGQLGWIKQIQLWDWLGSIKPQIDYLAGNQIGCNTIRFSTQCQGVPGGYFTQAAFDACVLQVADYCKSQGLYLYYSPMRYDNASLLGQPAEAIAAQVAGTVLKLQASYGSTVVGVDLLQEAYFAVGGAAITTAKIGAIVAEMKRLGVTLPITCSSQETISPTAGGTTWLNSAVQYFDYIDCHIYGTATDDYFEYMLANFPGKDIVIGEYGYNQGQAIDTIERNMRYVLRLANSGNPRIRGSMVWGCIQQDNQAANDWGVYSSTFGQRPYMARALRQYAGGQVSVANRPTRVA